MTRGDGRLTARISRPDPETMEMPRKAVSGLLYASKKNKNRLFLGDRKGYSEIKVALPVVNTTQYKEYKTAVEVPGSASTHQGGSHERRHSTGLFSYIGS